MDDLCATIIPELQLNKFDIDDEGPPRSDLDFEDSGDDREETTITTVNDDTLNDAINTVGADMSQAHVNDLREAREVLMEACR